MNIITPLSLILCGIFAAAGLAARLQRDPAPAVDALAWFQGWVGLPVAGCGIWGLILSLARLYQLQSNPIWWATFFGTAAFEVVLGTILAVGLLSVHAYHGSPQRQARGSALRRRLTTVEIPLGLLAVAVGFWCFAAAFLFHETWGS